MKSRAVESTPGVVLRRWWLWLVLGVVLVVASATRTSPACGSRFLYSSASLLAVADALAAYHQLHGKYPTEEEGLPLLREMGLIRNVRDGWGRAIVYRRSQEAPGWRAYSIGADGSDDGGAGDDIDGVRKDYRCSHYPQFCWDRYSIAGSTGSVLFVLGLLCALLRAAQAMHTLRTRADRAA